MVSNCLLGRSDSATERSKWFAEPNNSEALERTLKGIVPKKTQRGSSGL